MVVRKGAWADGFVSLAAMLAGEVEREHVLFPAAVFFGEHARTVTAFAEGELERVGEAAALVRAGDDAVDHDIELLGFAPGQEAGGFLEGGDGAIDADAREASTSEVGGGLEED
jgi:hypothetical protein